MEQIERLRTAIVESGLLSAVGADDEFVFGAARLPAAGVDVMVNVDPDLDETPDLDEAALLAGLERVLTMPPAQWREILDKIVDEIEEAVGEQPVIETVDLSDDLTVHSLVVLPDAALLSFAAPRQFPDSWIRVQLDEDLTVDDVVIDDKDDEGLAFDSLDDMLDHISSAGD